MMNASQNRLIEGFIEKASDKLMPARMRFRMPALNNAI
jgi:hypothetical protein